jgi:hypothetical protein
LRSPVDASAAGLCCGDRGFVWHARREHPPAVLVVAERVHVAIGVRRAGRAVDAGVQRRIHDSRAGRLINPRSEARVQSSTSMAHRENEVAHALAAPHDKCKSLGPVRSTGVRLDRFDSCLRCRLRPPAGA